MATDNQIQDWYNTYAVVAIKEHMGININHPKDAKRLRVPSLDKKSTRALFENGFSNSIADKRKLYEYASNGTLFAFRKEYDKEGRIIYDLTDTYFSNHPYEGEEVKHVKETFDWQYASPFGNKYCYKICSCSYLGEPPKFIPLEIVCYENGFNDSCFTIGHWDRDDEGYEFHSVGSRLFKYVHEKDVELIWRIIKEADDFLAKRYKEENGQ